MTKIITRLEDDGVRRAVGIRVDKDEPERKFFRVHVATLFEDKTTGLPSAIEGELESTWKTDLSELSEHDVASLCCRNNLDVVGDRAKGVHDLVLTHEFVEMRAASVEIGLEKEAKTFADLRDVHL